MADVTYNPGPGSSKIKYDLASPRPLDSSANQGPQRYAMGYAAVVRVNYEDFTCVLRIETGETFETEVPLAFPGAGSRHFFGSLPQPGDICQIGWKAQESGHNRQPVIINWVIPGVQSGHQWMPIQPFSPEEYSQSPSDAIRQEGVMDRIRHKLRHMQPGNIVASSAQGADLVLDESATLTNRRANEIRLRDADQAIVVRSLQQFHAGAGFRVYAGMVQRDATLLPSQMFSGRRLWDTVQLLDSEGEPVFETALEAYSGTPNTLRPHSVFSEDLDFDTWVDPGSFLQQGLFISSDGYRLDPKVPGSGTYGGKLAYRVAEGSSQDNAFRSAEADALTEYRIELSHTSDGTLPVTEQTDSFDADRLPNANPEEATTSVQSANRAFLEVVYGTVVGNDPFSLSGRESYGKPLAPVVFGEGETPRPALVPGAAGSLDDHAAMLFRMQPPTGRATPTTWWSVTKSGRALLSLGGPPGSPSLEGSLSRGGRLWMGRSPAGESLRLAGDGAVVFESGGRREDNAGFLVRSGGGVLISAEGPLNTGRGAVVAGAGVGKGEADQPSLHLKASTVLKLEAAQVQIKAPKFDLSDVASMGFNASAEVSLAAGTMIRQTSNSVETTTTGKHTLNASGPKDFRPTNGPYVEENISTSIPTTGVVKKTDVSMGKTQHTTGIGDVETRTRVGNVRNKSTVGSVQNKAGQNEWTTNSITGITGRAVVGSVSVRAIAGSSTISGSVSARMASVGPATVQGGAGVTLIGPGKKGLILCNTDRDPLTGLPLALYGMGSPGHRLG